MILRLGWTVWT